YPWWPGPAWRARTSTKCSPGWPRTRTSDRATRHLRDAGRLAATPRAPGDVGRLARSRVAGLLVFHPRCSQRDNWRMGRQRAARCVNHGSLAALGRTPPVNDGPTTDRTSDRDAWRPPHLAVGRASLRHVQRRRALDLVRRSVAEPALLHLPAV